MYLAICWVRLVRENRCRRTCRAITSSILSFITCTSSWLYDPARTAFSLELASCSRCESKRRNRHNDGWSDQSSVVLLILGFLEIQGLFGWHRKVPIQRRSLFERFVRTGIYHPTLTLADLRMIFRVLTFPDTLVFAGNRRKKQNIVQQSLAFSWGAAGIFERSDDLPNGPYGTR